MNYWQQIMGTFKCQGVSRRGALCLKMTALVLFVAQVGNSYGQEASFLSVKASLLADVKVSQQRLQSLQRLQLAERKKLSKQLHEIESRVLALRGETVHLQTLADEKTMALDDIKTRLKGWQDQENYQTYVLKEYLNKHLANPRPSKDAASLAELLKLAANNAGSQRTGLNPNWTTQDVVSRTGEIKSSKVLQIGPAQWAHIDNGSETIGGLVEEADSGSEGDTRGLPTRTLGMMFDSESIKEWPGLNQSSVGVLSFDPSFSRLSKLASIDESLIGHVQKGGVWVLPILAFGALALVTALLKCAQLFRMPKLEQNNLALIRTFAAESGEAEALLELKSLSNIETEIFEICRQTNIGEDREEQLFGYLVSLKNKLEASLGTLAVIATIAPLLGLLGTVSGMIATFRLMTVFGSGDASVVSGGISEALITTELGLIVAIPTLLIHAALKRLVSAYLADCESFATALNQKNVSNMRVFNGF